MARICLKPNALIREADNSVEDTRFLAVVLISAQPGIVSNLESFLDFALVPVEVLGVTERHKRISVDHAGDIRGAVVEACGACNPATKS